MPNYSIPRKVCPLVQKVDGNAFYSRIKRESCQLYKKRGRIVASGYRDEAITATPMEGYCGVYQHSTLFFRYIDIFFSRFLKNGDKFYVVMMCYYVMYIIFCMSYCQINSLIFHNVMILNCVCFLLHHFPLL